LADTQFFQTAMGREFFERTLPSIARELKRLNENLEKLSKQKEQEGTENVDKLQSTPPRV
jgi:hypothetical protein